MGAPIVAVPARRPVRKANIIVNELVTDDIDIGTGANVKTTTLYRCGAVTSATGAPTGNFVNDACTMVRFIFNGGFTAGQVQTSAYTIETLFMVVARVEVSLVASFNAGDNEFLTQSLQDTENIFFSGAWPVHFPTTTTSATGTVMHGITIDMKAKRKLNIGDTIVMYTFMKNLIGTTNTNIAVTGVSTIIAV